MEISFILYRQNCSTPLASLPALIPLETKQEDIRDMVYRFIPEDQKWCCRCLTPVNLEDRNCHYHAMGTSKAILLTLAYACAKNPLCQAVATKWIATAKTALDLTNLLCS